MVLSRRLRPAARGEPADDGAIAIIVALCLVVLLGLAALVVDLGLARERRAQAQAAADSAALAAAAVLAAEPDPAAGAAAAIDRAKDYAETNLDLPRGHWRGCADPGALAGWDTAAGNRCISWTSDPATRSGRVRVSIPVQELPSLFGGALGLGPLSSSATAEAAWGAAGGGGGECLVCVLGELAGGTGWLQATGGDVLVGGQMSFVGQRGGIAVQGGGGVGYAGGWNGQGAITPAPVRVPPPTDPEAGRLGPPLPVDPNQPARADRGACRPGTYTDLRGCSSLAPGGYVLAGDAASAPVRLPGVRARGVVLYLTCARQQGFGSAQRTFARPCAPPGEPGARLDGADAGPAELRAPSAGPARGLAIVADRRNSAEQDLVGGASLVIDGAVHLPHRGAAVTDDPSPAPSGQPGGAAPRTTIRGQLTVGQLRLAPGSSARLSIEPPALRPVGAPAGVRLVR